MCSGHATVAHIAKRLVCSYKKSLQGTVFMVQLQSADVFQHVLGYGKYNRPIVLWNLIGDALLKINGSRCMHVSSNKGVFLL